MILFAIIAALITFVCSFTVFEYSDQFIVFILFYLFAMSVFTFGYLISVCFTRSKLASIVAALLLLGLLAPSFVLNDGSTRQDRFRTKRTEVRATDCHLFILIQVRCASATG